MEDQSVLGNIDGFADDIFQYVYPRRLNVFYYRNPLNPTTMPEVFHPYIGMSVLCESHRRQKDFFTWYGIYFSNFSADRQSFMTFCTSLALHLLKENKDDLIKACISIASMILELGTYCHLRGEKHFKYFSGICWAEVFRHYIADDFFEKHAWSEFKEFAMEDARTYMEGQYEVLLDQNRVEFRTDWLRKYDLWGAMYDVGGDMFSNQQPPSQGTEESSVPETSTEDKKSDDEEMHQEPEDKKLDDEEVHQEPEDKKSDDDEEMHQEPEDKKLDVEEMHQGPEDKKLDVEEMHQEPSDKKDVDEEMHQKPKDVDSTLQVTESEDSVSMKMKHKPTPVTQKVNAKLLLEFKHIIYGGDYLNELFRLIESEREMNALMKSDVFVQVVTETVENSAERMKNENFLELMKILLLGNEDLATFFIKATRYITLTDSIGSMKREMLQSCEYTPEPYVPKAATPQSETASGTLPKDTKSRRELGAVPKRTRSGVDKDKALNKSYVKLIGQFKRAISSGSDLESIEICEILESKDVYLLLNCHVFRSMMELTVKFPVKLRWGNQWILSFIKSLIKSEKPTAEKSSSQVSETTPEFKVPTSRAPRRAKMPRQDKLLESLNPRGSSSDPPLPEPNTNPCYPDPNNSCGAADVNAVFLDIVNLNSSVKDLLDEVIIQRKSGISLPDFNFVVPCGKSVAPQNMSKPKKNRNRRNRRRNKGNEGKSVSSSLTGTSFDPLEEAVKSLKRVEEIYKEHGVDFSLYANRSDEEMMHSIEQRMASLGIEITPSTDEPFPCKWSKVSDIYRIIDTNRVAHEEISDETAADAGDESSAEADAAKEVGETDSTPAAEEMGETASTPAAEDMGATASTPAEDMGATASTPAEEMGATAATSTEETSIAPEDTQQDSMLQSVSDFKQILNQMPASSSNAIFDFLLQQAMESNPRFLETMKEKSCIGETEMNQLMMHFGKSQDSKAADSSEKIGQTDKELTAILPLSEKSNDPGALDKSTSPSQTSKEMSSATEKSPNVSGASQDE